MARARAPKTKEITIQLSPSQHQAIGGIVGQRQQLDEQVGVFLAAVAGGNPEIPVGTPAAMNMEAGTLTFVVPVVPKRRQRKPKAPPRNPRKPESK